MMEQRYTETNDIFKDAPVIYGGFWERFGAAFLDGLILLVPSLILQYTVSRELYLVLAILINWLYYASQESGAAQATFGKKALGLKVTTLSGGRISFGQATGRYFGKLISGLILLIGYLMMLWDNKKQTLHDKMAGTLVIKNEPHKL